MSEKRLITSAEGKKEEPGIIGLITRLKTQARESFRDLEKELITLEWLVEMS